MTKTPVIHMCRTEERESGGGGGGRKRYRERKGVRERGGKEIGESRTILTKIVILYTFFCSQTMGGLLNIYTVVHSFVIHPP